MKFLDEESLPLEMQGSTWKPYWQTILSQLDLAAIPPLPLSDGWIGAELALRLAYGEPQFRAALKKHTPPEKLDSFAAEVNRQTLSKQAGVWQPFVKDIGGPETARVLARGLIRLAGCRPIIRENAFGACCTGGALAEIGDVTALPAFFLAYSRMPRGHYRNLLEATRDAFIQKLGISALDLEDWSVPDEGDPAEMAGFRETQIQRLKKALMSARRWTVAMFDRRIVRQTVLAPLAAGLVWGYYNEAGGLMQPFSIDGGFAYPPPPAGAWVGIVHPAHLAPAEAAEWRKRAQALEAPFGQWKVPVFALSGKELKGDRIPRLPAIQMPAATLLCRLEALGWQRTKDRTLFQFHARPFPGLDVEAVIHYTGIPLTYGAEWPDQAILDCYFVSQRRQLRLDQVSSVAISAVLADLKALASAPRRGRGSSE